MARLTSVRARYPTALDMVRDCDATTGAHEHWQVLAVSLHQF
jgi:hypothetical protein